MAVKKSKKHYPVVRAAGLFNDGSQTTQNRVLHVDRELSKLNRRLYRQGRNYQVKIDCDHGETGNIGVYALRDDWAVQKAYQMAFQAYLDNTMEEREQLSESQIARWQDFRVAAGVVGDGIVAALVDETLAPVRLTSGSFDLTQVVDETNVQRTFTFAPSPGGTEYGILVEYDKAANAPTVPTDLSGAPGTRGPYIGLNTQINAATMSDLQGEGANPPYDRTGVNAATPFVKIAELGSTGGTQKLSTGYFNAPCGIVLLAGPTSNWNPANLSMEVKAGQYKGVHAPAMVEMATVNRKRKVVK